MGTYFRVGQQYPYVYCYGPKHVCRRYPTLNVTGAPPRVGSLHRTPPVLRIIPEHQRGLHAGEENAMCHGFTPSAALGTPCHTRSVHLSLSRFNLTEPPTPRDTEASNAYAVIHDSLGSVYMCSLI